jgi:glutaredoxin 3|tara:strand:- start:122 stop:358 length:237 start_codon:yes stop_codon:yes gene_type:complete
MKIVIWSKPDCPFCVRAKHECDKRGIAYDEKLIGFNGLTKEDLLSVAPNARSVPQIFIDGQLIGGYTELMKSNILDSQ